MMRASSDLDKATLRLWLWLVAAVAVGVGLARWAIG
jgi:hypothetical protein